MTLTCADCTAAYAVGIRACPQCGSERIVREDNNMPKITVAAGATHPDTDLTERTDDEGGEQSSPGTSSSTSPESSPKKPEPNEPDRRSPARTTASRSKKGRTGSRSVSTTGGDPKVSGGADA